MFLNNDLFNMINLGGFDQPEYADKN